ncbi:MAG: hypothetical protein NVV57_10510 [Demequina sp.]|nr:hypothetical protein [Demequina sp.]
MIDGGADTVVAIGESFTPSQIAANWDAYAQAVKERGIVAGTNYVLVTQPTDAIDATMTSSLGCLTDAACIAIPENQYRTGHGLAQLETTAAFVATAAVADIAFAGSAALIGTPAKSVVIGRYMDARVIPFARTNGFGYYHGTPNWIRKAVEKSAGQGALRKVDLWSNMIWIEKQKLLSRRIVDIGPGPAKDTSAFYQMERNRTAGYWRYVEEHRG